VAVAQHELVKPFSLTGSGSSSSLFPNGAPAGMSSTGSGVPQAVMPNGSSTSSTSNTSILNQTNPNAGLGSIQQPITYQGQDVFIQNGNIMLGGSGAYGPGGSSSGVSGATSQGSFSDMMSSLGNAITSGAQGLANWSSQHPVESAVVSAVASALGLGTIWTTVSVAAKVINWLHKKFGSNTQTTSTSNTVGANLNLNQSSTGQTGVNYGLSGSVNPTVTVGNATPTPAPVTSDTNNYEQYSVGDTLNDEEADF
jgi:hypothetical protein